MSGFVERISDAFAAVPAPRPPLVNHECDECAELQADFLGKSWREIPPTLLTDRYSKLPLFSAEAFHAFIPAYLSHSVENFEEFDGDLVCEFTAYALLPDKLVNQDQSHQNWWVYKLAQFTDEQFKVLVDYLDLVRDSEFSFDRKLLERGRARLLKLRYIAISKEPQ
jgi:hypothetical protein